MLIRAIIHQYVTCKCRENIAHNYPVFPLFYPDGIKGFLYIRTGGLAEHGGNS